MAGERRINWGADATDAQYRTGDDDANDRFILVEDLNGGTVLLERDESAGEFVYRGPVNMDGNDVSNVGALDSTSVSTGTAEITGETDIYATRESEKVGISSGTFENIVDTEQSDNRNEFNESGNNEFVPDKSGKYRVSGFLGIEGAGTNDRITARLFNTTDSAIVEFNMLLTNVDTTRFPSVPFSAVYDLSAGKSYVFEATDDDNSFTLSNNLNRLRIIKEPVD